VLRVEPDRLSAELGAGVADIAHIIPEIRQRLTVPESPAADPDSERWRLLQAIADFLRSASRPEPLLIVLEDLMLPTQPALTC
jgi:hypothetical protein